MLAFLLLSPLTTEGLLVFLELEFYPSWNLESENYFISNLHIKLQRTEDTFYKNSYHTDSLYSFQTVTKPKFMLPSHSLEARKITNFKSGVIRVSIAGVSCFWAGASTALWIEMKQKIAKNFSDSEFTHICSQIRSCFKRRTCSASQMLSCQAFHAHVCMNLPGIMSEYMQQEAAQGIRTQSHSINKEGVQSCSGSLSREPLFLCFHWKTASSVLQWKHTWQSPSCTGCCTKPIDLVFQTKELPVFPRDSMSDFRSWLL